MSATESQAPLIVARWRGARLVIAAAAVVFAGLALAGTLAPAYAFAGFVIVSAAVWVMRATDPDVPRPFRAPMVPVVSTMGILVNGAMMFFLGPENWLRLFIWLVLGLGIYFGFSRRHSALRKQASEFADLT